MAMTKAEVCRAFREVMAADYADVPAKEELDRTFSPEFYANMDALIAEQKRGSWRLLSCKSRRALVVAAILTASLLLVACTPKLREAVTELVVTVYETFVDFVVDTEETPLRTEIESVYTFDPIPDGFQLESSKEFENHYVENSYKNADGDLLILRQSSSSISGTVDSEHSKVVSSVVNGSDVLFHLSQQINIGLWTQDGYYFCMTYRGTIQQSDLERLVALVVLQE